MSSTPPARPIRRLRARRVLPRHGHPRLAALHSQLDAPPMPHLLLRRGRGKLADRLVEDAPAGIPRLSRQRRSERRGRAEARAQYVESSRPRSHRAAASYTATPSAPPPAQRLARAQFQPLLTRPITSSRVSPILQREARRRTTTARRAIAEDNPRTRPGGRFGVVAETSLATRRRAPVAATSSASAPLRQIWGAADSRRSDVRHGPHGHAAASEAEGRADLMNYQGLAAASTDAQCSQSKYEAIKWSGFSRPHYTGTHGRRRPAVRRSSPRSCPRSARWPAPCRGGGGRQHRMSRHQRRGLFRAIELVADRSTRRVARGAKTSRALRWRGLMVIPWAARSTCAWRQWPVTVKRQR